MQINELNEQNLGIDKFQITHKQTDNHIDLLNEILAKIKGSVG